MWIGTFVVPTWRSFTRAQGPCTMQGVGATSLASSVQTMGQLVVVWHTLGVCASEGCNGQQSPGHEWRVRQYLQCTISNSTNFGKPCTEQFIILLNLYTILRLGFSKVDWCYCVYTSPLSASPYKWLLHCVMCKNSLRFCAYFSIRIITCVCECIWSVA